MCQALFEVGAWDTVIITIISNNKTRPKVVPLGLCFRESSQETINGIDKKITLYGKDVSHL